MPRNGHTRESIFDESDIVDRAEAEPPAPPASTQPPATPPTQRARRRWKSPAAAATVAITVAVLVVGGYYGVKNATSATTKAQPPAAPVAAAQVPDLPLGAMACKKLYNDIQIPFDAGARGTPTTSCPFVEQVRRTYSQLSATAAPTEQLHAISPATERWYDLACIPTSNYVTCTGGAAAVIYLYNTQRG